MGTQCSPRGIADAQFFDDQGITQTALQQVVHGFGMTGELELIEGRGVVEQLSSRRELFAQVGEALVKGEMLTQLDETNQVAAAPTAVTVEQILKRVDVKGGMGFLMQRTQAHELGAISNGTTGPVVLLEELQ